MDEIELVGAKVLGPQQLRRPVDIAGTQGDTLDLELLRFGRVVAQLHVFDIPLP
jgi:hypothetical protein